MLNKATQLVRFDWAIKHILRDKANFVVLEGFLSVLLKEKMIIKAVLSSAGQKEDADDKYNDVDVLVENTQGELIIIEVQNSKEDDYFQRMLYGASKVITDYIGEGKPYAEVKKVISITIAYFDLGQGKDYVYHGTTNFIGLRQGDTLSLSKKQEELYKKSSIHQIYPEYWLIKADLLNNDTIQDDLDEWIYFFKNSEVPDHFKAQGLAEAKEKLDKLKLSPKEREAYENFVERLRKIASIKLTELEDVKELLKEEIKKAKGEQEEEIVLGFYDNEVPIPIIAKSLKVTEERVSAIIEKHRKYPT
jgi:predicted transposase/invertase (TIGR01784 family)